MLAKYPKGKFCAGCQLEELGTGFAPAVGPSNSRMLFVGEALGYNEAMQGEPFIGAAGGMLDRLLHRATISRPTIRIHNQINCRPSEDWLSGAPWQHSALAHCRPYLQESLDQPSLQVVVTLGEIPLKSILELWGTEGVRVQDFHGTVHRDPSDRFWVVPTYHPSHLQRGAINLFDVVRFDIDRAKSILAAGGTWSPRPVSLVLDPPVAWFEKWVQQALERFRADPESILLAVDIETPDKEGGKDEGELTSEDQSTKILRVNFAVGPDEGVTVPYEGPYIALINQAITSGITLLMWNKWYDESRLRFNGHDFDTNNVTILDGMWAYHHLQSDHPLGLGFCSTFFCDYGAWKHLGRQHGKEAEYAAVDGFKTWRTVTGVIEKLTAAGLWDSFYRHTHLREQYVLRPAHMAGVLVDVPKLDAFHDRLQVIAAEKLEALNQSNLVGTYKPKDGYAKKPKGPACEVCKGTGTSEIIEDAQTCIECGGAGYHSPAPPVSVVGKAGEKGDKAKADYISQGVQLVEREVPVQVRTCTTCGKDGVGPTHNCLRRKRGKVEDGSELPPGDGQDDLASTIATEVRTQTRWFWKLPFNPDANAQILKFIRDSGEQPGKAKKTRKDTANKETLRKLHRRTGDPVYKHILDYKAVKKVDSTYALGMKKRIWSDGRLHPIATFRPSMFRDSYTSPNIQNIIADKEGKDSLAAGFRECLVASPGCRLVEVDYAGIEGVDTGWLCGDPDYVRLATLGVHAYLTGYLLKEEGKVGEAPSLAWSDADLATYFAEVKKKFPALYDKAKRCVHGNNYGLTTFGMVENFPDVFTGGLKEATKVQDIYYALAPKLPAFHQRMRDLAYENEYLGGPPVDDYTLLTTSGKYHPFGYRHSFYGVQSYRPMTQSAYARLQWIARKRMKRDRHPRVRIINNRPFEVVFGEDSKRVIALFPQSIAAGQLKESELSLFHPDSPDYIEPITNGHTPFIAPIHDSLLLDVPDHLTDWVVSHVVEVMRRPFLAMPMPAEWGRGNYLRINVEVKVSPVGGSWAQVEKIAIPGMQPETASEVLFLPVEESEYEDNIDLETRIA